MAFEESKQHLKGVRIGKVIQTGDTINLLFSSEINNADFLQQEMKTAVRQYISEKKFLIELLGYRGYPMGEAEIKDLSEDRIAKIKEIFQDSVNIAKKYKTSCWVLFEYSLFLHYLGCYDEVIEILEWMKSYGAREEWHSYELEQIDLLLDSIKTMVKNSKNSNSDN